MRRGVGMLAIVLLLGAIASIVVMITHSLWRGSSRTLFSIQEHRQLVSLARSCCAEAVYRLQARLDASEAAAVDACLAADAPALAVAPEETRVQAANIDAAGARSDPSALAYTVTDVAVTRVRALDAERGDALGELDLKVTAKVRRAYPPHAADLTMTERHVFRLADGLGPAAAAGRHVELSLTPAGTVIAE